MLCSRLMLADLMRQNRARRRWLMPRQLLGRRLVLRHRLMWHGPMLERLRVGLILDTCLILSCGMMLRR